MSPLLNEKNNISTTLPFTRNFCVLLTHILQMFFCNLHAKRNEYFIQQGSHHLLYVKKLKPLLHVKTLNLEISRRHLADYVKEFCLSACRTCSTIIFPHSTNQITVFSRCRCRCRCRRPPLNSLYWWVKEIMRTER